MTYQYPPIHRMKYLLSWFIAIINTRGMSASSIIPNIIKGAGVQKTGYLLVTFESITTNDGNYLDYDVVKNPAGTDISNSTKSQLREEKGTKLDSIKLPTSGIEKVIASLKGEAPIIIYDVSLRANNDYESSGTH